MAHRRGTVKGMLAEIERGLTRLSIRLDHDASWLAHILYLVRGLLRDPAAETLDAPAPPLRLMRVKLLREAARAGVSSLDMAPTPEGPWLIAIGGARPFRLAAHLAAFLRVIAAPGGKLDDDALVGWKAYPQVAAALGLPANATRQHITRLVWHLREALEGASQNRFLVQTHPRRGLRFALRRSDHREAA